MQPKPLNNRGSILVESIVVLPLSVLLLSFFLELARRPIYELSAQWASFSAARLAPVGGSALATTKTRQWLRSVLRGMPMRQKRVLIEGEGHSWKSQVFLRFPSMQRDTRKHFQLSRRCRFSFPY